MISFVVPAYNEEAVLGATLDAIRAAAEPLGEPWEMVVANDGSTDRTAEVARERGARVVEVRARQIAAARNAGAREARGDILVFVDADTLINEATLREALAALRAGAVGGGARPILEGVSVSLRAVLVVFTFFWRLTGWATGCFLYARADAFRAVGGWDERYFASEEVHLSRALKRKGMFVIVRTPVVTSGRKGRMHSTFGLLYYSLRTLVRPGALRRREGLELWYDGRREGPRE